MLSKNRFNQSKWRMTYEEYQKCYCETCNNKKCIHRATFRRFPETDGGLGLCPNLKN